jgi:hypothetical protein
VALFYQTKSEDQVNYTNKHGIKSASTIDALSHNDYDLKDKPENVYSCTEIIDAPKKQILARRHKDEIIVDIADRFWTMDGSAIHYAIEMSNKTNGANRLSEERLYLRISGDKVACFTLNDGEQLRDAAWYDADSIFVSVKFDQYEEITGTLEDNKRTSVWETIYGLKVSRIQQLNIGALALRLIGFSVNLLRAVLFLKDWNRRDYKSDIQRNGDAGKYPAIPYYEAEVPPASIEDQIEFMVERANLHNEMGKLEDDQIPECTPEERWYRGEAIAVMKVGVQRAKKVFKVGDGVSLETAKQMAGEYMATLMMGDSKGKYVTEHRPGTNQRCLEYCEVRQFCHFGKTLVEAEETEE